MSTSLFEVTEHIIQCQYIREYPHAQKIDQRPLKLAIKEYRPLKNLGAAAAGSVTLIATHANGLAKETYEPLWDDLYNQLGSKLRAIWIADSSHQGASGVLNEHLQGDDPFWFDHSRDLLSMVNHFWERMPRTIFGIGHSMGAAQLVQLSLFHPRLFYGLALIEPVIQQGPPSGPNAAFLTSYRPGWWPSRDAAAESFRKIRFFKTWDPRVLDKYVRYGLRKTPTAIYPANSCTPSGAVTLTTTKHQEAWTYVRSNFASQSNDANDRQELLLSPDLDPNNSGVRAYVFHRAECIQALEGLSRVRPSILWIFGAQSPINTPALQDEKMSLSGTGLGGSGGKRVGKVEKEVVEGAGHMVPFEKVGDCASLLARWVNKQMVNFEADEQFYREYDSKKSERGRFIMSKDWLAGVRQKADTKRPVKGKL